MLLWADLLLPKLRLLASVASLASCSNTELDYGGGAQIINDWSGSGHWWVPCLTRDTIVSCLQVVHQPGNIITCALLYQSRVMQVKLGGLLQYVLHALL